MKKAMSKEEAVNEVILVVENINKKRKPRIGRYKGSAYTLNLAGLGKIKVGQLKLTICQDNSLAQQIIDSPVKTVILSTQEPLDWNKKLHGE